MNAVNLVMMANQIGAFFDTMPDRQQALEDIAAHLRRYWEPRMRRALMHHIDSAGGMELDDIVLDAVRAHRVSLF